MKTKSIFFLALLFPSVAFAGQANKDLLKEFEKHRTMEKEVIRLRREGVTPVLR